MSVLGPVLVFAAVLGGLALAGPYLLRRSAPVLVRLPHLAAVLIPTGALLWLAGIFIIGPLLAWMSSGPVILPGSAAEVCQRCIDAANPFGMQPLTTIVPTALLFIIPALAAAAFIAGLIHQLRVRRTEMKATAKSLLAGGRRDRISGFDVTIVPRGFVASSLPAGHGGIVLSQAVLDVLSDDELKAVLAHEHAHVSHRHHYIRALSDSLAALLGWVPLIAECGRTLPNYLEIAADRHAQKTAGTPAVVSALITLGERQQHADGVLHMAGPERVKQLVAPVQGTAGALPAAAIAFHLVTLAGFIVLVMAPYGSAIIAGCL